MGNSPLHIACLNGQGHIIAELMKHGASVNAVNNKNQVSGKLKSKGNKKINLHGNVICNMRCNKSFIIAAKISLNLS